MEGRGWSCDVESVEEEERVGVFIEKEVVKIQVER